MKAKERLPRIIKILAVEPFKIEALWSTAEVRFIDFAPLFKQWQVSNDTRLYLLMEYAIYRNVKVSENRTLTWHSILIICVTFKNKKRYLIRYLQPFIIKSLAD